MASEQHLGLSEQHLGSTEEERGRADKTETGYTDASSLPLSSTTRDQTVNASDEPSTTVAAKQGEEEVGSSRSTSASSCYVDARSDTSPTCPESADPLYVDAFSKGGTSPPETQHSPAHSTEGPAVKTFTHQPEPIKGRGQGEHIVYFELEKTKDTGQDSAQNNLPQTMPVFKGQTLAKANVKVADRAKLFEAGPPNANAFISAKGNPVYDIPPALQTAPQTVTDFNAHRLTEGKTPSNDSVYEIADDQSSQASAFQSSGEVSGVYEVVGKSHTVRTRPRRPPTYELAGPMGDEKRSSQTLPNTGKDLSGSGGFVSCKQGSVRQDRVQVMVPSQKEIEEEYQRLQFSRKVDSKSPEEAGYNTLKQLANSSTDPSTNEPLYDCPVTCRNGQTWGSDEWSDGSWGSSEFEEYEDEDGYLAEPDTPAPTKPLPRVPRGHEAGDSLQKLPGALLNKLRHANARSPVPEDPDAVCLPVTINPSKHPPPELPPPPPGLSENQKKRRCVVELTISSERSYIESLERIVQEYERSILEVISSPKSHVRSVFREAKEILNHHKMFQIELSDTVQKWDSQEKIGDIFTASFSKTMLVDAYSIYVNNFAAGMDEIRTAQQSRLTFDEFLKMKEKSSYDRLSIFGLMVKPVQRFPQFIMLIQDLIKYTPRSHHDRQALQLALTELENVAHKLNERKRLSEQYFQAKRIMQMLPRQLPNQVLSGRNMEKERRLIRFDNFDQIDGEMENMKSSSRRLFLMDDVVVCVKVGIKDQDGFMMERYRLKWAIRLCDAELKDTAMTPDMQNVVKMDANRLRAITSQLEKSEEDPFHLYADLRDMLHDLSVFGQITQQMQSLRRSYQGYNMPDELFNEVTSDLQKMIQIKDEQLRLVNSCSIILVDNSKADKPHYVMQTPTAAVKNEWCVDFNMAKLAIEKQNKPGWGRSPLAGSDDLEPVPALFMKCVPVDVPRNFTKVRCAIPVFMPSMPQVNGLGVQHLWVCTSTSSRGQVSVVSLYNTRPALTESFKACDCEVLCAELVSGCGLETEASHFLFSEDTVWMGNTHNEIVIFPLSSWGEGSTATRDPLAVVRVRGRVTSIKFVDERLFCGLDSGILIVYSRNDVGEWCIKSGRSLELGQSPIRCQVVVRDDLWVACGHHVHVVQIDSLHVLASHKLSGSQETTVLQIVRSGVGVWAAFQHSAAVRLFHLETMENLQEMSVANIINRVLEEKSGCPETRDCVVTCLAASTGLLWIGTSVGVILTLPLPRLSDGVPLYSGRPAVAYHAHRGPVRFIIPVYCSGSILELHKNSSLRSNLRARPSLRNRKREVIELQGVAEEKLLSSGTELDHGLRPTPAGPRADRTATTGSEPSPPKPSPVPEKMKDAVMKSQAGRKFFRRFRDGKGDSKTSSLKAKKKLTHPVQRSKSRTLSFRSELANRIKQTTLGGRFQSMFDLRGNDSLEVEMFYENLLDAGDISEEEETTEALDSLSIRSDSAALDENLSSTFTFPPVKGKAVESLDLAGLNNTPTPPTLPSISPASSSSTTSAVGADGRSRSVTETELTEALPRQLGPHHRSPPSSPRIANMRANTMRKTSTSNAVMVLSGGDGYWDMHTGGNYSKNEDASLLFWIYKF
ncbi:rho guanine nucleotide exchange factor 10-like protein [Babylonia areolata]|uniref:rho guanine nucleotide exchange factor 10-like protein n=1 Tax=Babylonia areolata TaxID=304850 RepID=UPI003FCFC929